MPLLNALEFAKDALFVRYRASAEPQELAIDIQNSGRAPQEAAPQEIRCIMDRIQHGAASGQEFAPWTGVAELLSGPWNPPESLGPDYSYRLRVANVSPLFLRTMVERLRACGWDKPVRSMSLIGSLPLDSSNLSVRENHVKMWLDDATAYVGQWPDVPFPIVTREVQGASLRVVLAERITPQIREELESFSIEWTNAVVYYVGPDGTSVPPYLRLDRRLPTFGRTKTEFRASYEEFLHTRRPARDVLVNMLIWFHHKVARIVEAEIGL